MVKPDEGCFDWNISHGRDGINIAWISLSLSLFFVAEYNVVFRSLIGVFLSSPKTVGRLLRVELKGRIRIGAKAEVGSARRRVRPPSSFGYRKTIKNLWRRKCVRKMIFRNVEVRVEGRFVPFNPYFVCNTAIGSLNDLYGFTLPKKLT